MIRRILIGREAYYMVDHTGSSHKGSFATNQGQIKKNCHMATSRVGGTIPFFIFPKFQTHGRSFP